MNEYIMIWVDKNQNDETTLDQNICYVYFDATDISILEARNLLLKIKGGKVIKTDKFKKLEWVQFASPLFSFIDINMFFTESGIDFGICNIKEINWLVGQWEQHYTSQYNIVKIKLIKEKLIEINNQTI